MTGTDTSTATFQVTVVWCPAPSVVMEHSLTVLRGCCVEQALSGMTKLPDTGLSLVGVWGRAVLSDHMLEDGDRIELYRPLKVDPKIARQERFKMQGRRSAGLFAKKTSSLNR